MKKGLSKYKSKLDEFIKVDLDKTSDQQILFAFGLNHKTAPIEVRERLYVHEWEIPELIALLKQNLAECVVLSTCNRTEIYGVASAATVDLEYLQRPCY